MAASLTSTPSTENPRSWIRLLSRPLPQPTSSSLSGLGEFAGSSAFRKASSWGVDSLVGIVPASNPRQSSAESRMNGR